MHFRYILQLQVIRDGNDSCDIKESEENTSETRARTPKDDIHQIGDKADRSW